MLMRAAIIACNRNPSLTLEIEGLPGSTNATYRTGQHRQAKPYKLKSEIEWQWAQANELRELMRLHDWFPLDQRTRLMVTLLLETPALWVGDVDGKLKTVLDMVSQATCVNPPEEYFKAGPRKGQPKPVKVIGSVDDRYIVACPAVKIWGPEPRTYVTVTAILDPDTLALFEKGG